MAGVYRPRHPERTVLYRVVFHDFDRFLAEYESRFEKEYGYLRPQCRGLRACHLLRSSRSGLQSLYDQRYPVQSRCRRTGGQVSTFNKFGCIKKAVAQVQG
jgi:hypothetical protein